MKWNVYDPMLYGRQKLPGERKCVLLAFAKTEDKAASIAVGYLRYAAGDAQSPQFITPGIGGIPTHWADILEQPFESPHWATIEAHGKPARHYGLKLQNL